MTPQTSTSLKHDLDAFREEWTRRVGADTATLVAQDIDNLRQSGLLDRVARAGSPVPALSLPDATGDRVDCAPSPRMARSILSLFYRGGWCPTAIWSCAATSGG